ncbi:bifunctional epoxide hydrolase 2-like [Cucumis melo var. makuwa]|uniref:soluble epoxide hydrolase n=1 Tax=Cucumis melo var. makuwa TaxID=1194695 RepID=A0A5A7TLI9_CUCMM|nr:bifunctional epoxide hydrolase 2-like [Cucumis melo var. makuwa]
MEAIEHTTINTNGINMHIASIGTGPVVLLLHGFPELWYSWRHQLLYLSSVGYRAIAPDLRGFGDTDAPESHTVYTPFHIVGDLVGVLDELGIEKVFVVGHDWGAIIAWYLCLFRPDRVKALVNLSVHFLRRNPTISFVQGFRIAFGDDFYICRFQVPGEAEKDFGSIDTAELFKKFLCGRSPDPPILSKEFGIRSIPSPQNLPSWLSQEDINYFATKFNRTGFTGGFNYYRALDLTWELSASWNKAQVQVPVKFIVGDLDLTYHFPGAKEYIHNGGFKTDVPFLEEVVVMEDTAHFINQERPHEISAHIHDFIKKF